MQANRCIGEYLKACPYRDEQTQEYYNGLAAVCCIEPVIDPRFERSMERPATKTYGIHRIDFLKQYHFQGDTNCTRLRVSCVARMGSVAIQFRTRSIRENYDCTLLPCRSAAKYYLNLS